MNLKPHHRRLRYIHEALFSLTAGLATTIALVASGWALNTLRVMEVHINHMLHIRQCDLIRGYFAFYVPFIAISLSTWALIRFTAYSRLTNRLLYSVAGPLALVVMPAYWLYLALTTNLWGWYGSQRWRFGASPFEAILGLAAILVYLSGNWPLPKWTLIPLLAIHFFFWAMPIHASCNRLRSCCGAAPASARLRSWKPSSPR